MSTTEDLIDEPRRVRGSSKLLAEWGHREPAGTQADWMTILRAGGATLVAPRLVVSGTAMSGLAARPALALSGAANA